MRAVLGRSMGWVIVAVLGLASTSAAAVSSELPPDEPMMRDLASELGDRALTEDEMTEVRAAIHFKSFFYRTGYIISANALAINRFGQNGGWNRLWDNAGEVWALRDDLWYQGRRVQVWIYDYAKGIWRYGWTSGRYNRGWQYYGVYWACVDVRDEMFECDSNNSLCSYYVP